MSSFKGTKSITLQPKSADVPYTFSFPACSSASANDGLLPFGHTIDTCDVTAYDAAGNDVTAEMVGAQVLIVDNVVGIQLTYPATSGPGTYRLTFEITTDGNAVDEFDFDNVVVVDL